jgi:chorismate mutase
MLAQSILALFASVAVTSVAETAHEQWSLQPDARPFLQVPSLTEVRDILTRMEAPIISSIVSRAALPAEEERYDYEGDYLLDFINAEEWYG